MKAGFLIITLLFISSNLLSAFDPVISTPGFQHQMNSSIDISYEVINFEDDDTTILDRALKEPEKKPKYGHDSAQCVINYFLYRQSFRDWGNTQDEFYFNDLYPSWTYVFLNCPGYRLNTFINGVPILEHRIAQLSGEEKAATIDTLLMLFDERILYFGDEPFVLGAKATAMVKHIPDSIKKIFSVLQEVIELNGKNSANHLVVFYMQYAVYMHEAGHMSLMDLIDIYIEVDEIATYNIELEDERSAEYIESMDRIEQLMLNYLECDVMNDVFRPRYLADSTNVELCRKIIGLMAVKRCYDQPLFQRTLNQLNRLDPTPRLLMIQGNYFFRDGNYTEALKSFRKAVEGFDEDNVREKFDAYLRIAEIHLLEKRYPEGRTAVINALRLRPDEPNALIMLGDIYLHGANTCGSSLIAKHVGFWAAFEKYQRAQSLSNDPVVNSKAANGISNARHGFPTTADLFFEGYRPGQTVTAPCWIGETVVIRASDS